MPDVVLVLPEGSLSDHDRTGLSGALRSLTEKIINRTDTERVGGLLGGEFGYGVEHANAEFMMHPYCWCEQPETCPWCCGCDCENWPGAKCPGCLTGGPAAEYGGGPGVEAPNFWHKPTGFRVWWYKWIGRGMRIANPQSVGWVGVVAASIESVGEHEY